MNRPALFSKIFLMLATVVYLASSTSSLLPVSAQTTDDSWSQPLNLSKSGGTMDPVVVSDSNNTTHVIWTDVNSGYTYTHTADGGWTKPAKISLPFTLPPRSAAGTAPPAPKFFPGLKGRVHAFWLEGTRLRTSYVGGDRFGVRGSWGQTVMLGFSVLYYDVAVDAQGVIHVVYLQTSDIPNYPSGIYYVRSPDNGYNWNKPVLLYGSRYFRSLTAETPNSIDITTTFINRTSTVYLAFDNMPRKRIYLMRSDDGGTKWNEPLEIDHPSAEGGLAGPFDIKVDAHGNDVILAWQSGTPNSTCSHYFKSSKDGGKSWGDLQRMLTSFADCSQEKEFINGYQGYSLLRVNIQDQVYLTAWDTQQWSILQPQPTLSRFVDPETFLNVTLRKRSFTLAGENRLIVVGYDEGPGGDTWMTLQQLSNIHSWFPSKPTWRKLEVVFKSPNLPESVRLLADAQGGVHAFWDQLEVPVSVPGETVSQKPEKVIYYSYWNGAAWQPPTAVLQSPQGGASLPSAALDAARRISVAWKADETGEIFYSWSDATTAGSALEWSAPTRISGIPGLAAYPEVASDPSGYVYIVYSIPINEKRGIYIHRSTDLGKTWDDPVQIFDGTAAGWEIVEKAAMTINASGHIHVIFTRKTFEPDSAGQGLYSSRSMDGGQTWSTIELVSARKVVWTRIFAQGDHNLHRLWKEDQNGQITMLHQYSNDGGQTWSRVLRVTDTSETIQPAGAAIDSYGGLHVLEMLSESDDRLELRYIRWQNGRWIAEDPRDFGRGQVSDKTAFDMAITSKGLLAAMGSRTYLDLDTRKKGYEVYFSDRAVEISGSQPEEVSALPTVNPSETPEITPTPGPTPTINVSGLGPVNRTRSSMLSGMMIGVGAAVFGILGAVVYAIWQAKKHRSN